MSYSNIGKIDNSSHSNNTERNAMESLKTQNIMVQKTLAITITPHPTYVELYSQNLKLDIYRETLKEHGLESCPFIYVNEHGQAIRHVEWLIVVQELFPEGEVNVHLHNPGYAETWDIIRHANTYGRKSYGTLIKEILKLKEYFKLPQGHRSDLAGGEKHNTNQIIADTLDISQSLISRLLLINKIAPKLIEKLDRAERKGTDEKLSVSRQAQLCGDIEKLIQEIPDEALKAKWFEDVYRSETLPEQLFSLIREAKGKIKTGIPKQEAYQEIIGSDVKNSPASSCETSLLDVLEIGTEVDRPELQIAFNLQERKNVTPMTLFQILFPQPSALEFEKEFIQVVEKIYRNLNHSKAA